MLRLALVLFAGLLALAAPQSQAAPFPDRPIRIIVPYPPGGTTDIMARAMQGPLSRILGQPIIIDNRAGAAGIIGTREVARSAPDGYTLLFSNDGPSVIAPFLQKQPGFDPIRSFTPLSLVSTQALLLVVNAALPVSDLKSFIAYAKQEKKPLLYASAGAGSLGHLSTELFAQTAGIQLTHVPYKGSAPATLGVMSGEVQVLLTTSTPSMQEYIQGGKLKLLGVSTSRPETLPPGTPLVSSTLPDFKQDIWFGILGPAGLPNDVANALNKAIREVVANPDVQRIFTGAGFIPVSSTREEFQAIITSGAKQWQQVIADHGITVE